MVTVQRAYARRLTGKLVKVACVNGSSYRGRLIGFNGRSLWLLSEGQDCFVDVTDVVGLAPASI